MSDTWEIIILALGWAAFIVGTIIAIIKCAKDEKEEVKKAFDCLNEIRTKRPDLDLPRTIPLCDLLSPQNQKPEKTLYKCDYCGCTTEKTGICEHCGAPVRFMWIISKV